jgi:hypothetical protein
MWIEKIIPQQFIRFLFFNGCIGVKTGDLWWDGLKVWKS